MEFRVTEIAAFLKGEIVGDVNVTVSNVSKIEAGEPGTLAFLANPKYENHLYTTRASVVLVNRSFVPKQPVSATLIKVDDAYQAFASLLDLYVQAKMAAKTGVEQPSYTDESATLGRNIYIGAFAYIGKNVKIGENTKIYPQVYVGDNVTIGSDCIVFAGAKIYEDTQIGNRCIIHAGAVIGSDGFGFAPLNDGSYKKIHQIGNVIVEDDVEIGANTTVDCATMGSTIIRKGVKLDNLIQIAHNCEIGENTVMAAQTGIAGSSKIGNNCMFGGQSGVAGHITIGNRVNVGAQSGILKPVPDHSQIWGTPAINLLEQTKALVVFRELPKLRNEIFRLKKEIEKINPPADKK